MTKIEAINMAILSLKRAKELILAKEKVDYYKRFWRSISYGYCHTNKFCASCSLDAEADYLPHAALCYFTKGQKLTFCQCGVEALRLADAGYFDYALKPLTILLDKMQSDLKEEEEL